MKILADTCAFLAVVLNEPERARILELTAGHELVAPEILPFEIANALTALAKRKAFDTSELVAAWDSIEQIAVELRAIDVRSALDLALGLDVYAYDAYFLECALRLHLPILTLDTKMKRHANHLGIVILE